MQIAIDYCDGCGRIRPQQSELYRDYYMAFAPDSMFVWVKNNRVTLTPTEWLVLKYLIDYRGTLLSYRNMVQGVFGSVPRAECTIRFHVMNIRNKLEAAAGGEKSPIRCVPRHGYSYGG